MTAGLQIVYLTHTHTQPQFDLTIMQDPQGSFLIPHASNQV